MPSSMQPKFAECMSPVAKADTQFRYGNPALAGSGSSQIRPEISDLHFQLRLLPGLWVAPLHLNQFSMVHRWLGLIQ
jgi:hypothetical protein